MHIGNIHFTIKFVAVLQRTVAQKGHGHGHGHGLYIYAFAHGLARDQRISVTATVLTHTHLYLKIPVEFVAFSRYAPSFAGLSKCMRVISCAIA
jgi:hypothetical protein